MQPKNPKQPVYSERRQTELPGQTAPAGRATQTGGKGLMGMPAPEEPWLKKTVRLRREHLFLIVAVVCAFAVIMSVNYSRVKTLEADLSMARSAVTEANNELADLERQLQFASTEEYIDREARERFGYIKPGEVRFIMDDAAYYSGIGEQQAQHMAEQEKIFEQQVMMQQGTWSEETQAQEEAAQDGQGE